MNNLPLSLVNTQLSQGMYWVINTRIPTTFGVQVFVQDTDNGKRFFMVDENDRYARTTVTAIKSAVSTDKY